MLSYFLFASEKIHGIRAEHGYGVRQLVAQQPELQGHGLGVHDILFDAHDAHDAVQIPERVIVSDAGSLRKTKSPRLLCSKPLFPTQPGLWVLYFTTSPNLPLS